MNKTGEPLNDLYEIKQMMEKSSRFISLSGWSGVAAGTCALIGTYFAHEALKQNYFSYNTSEQFRYNYFPFFVQQLLHDRLFHVAMATFFAAFISAFVFTYIRMKRKSDYPLWNSAARRLVFSVLFPMLVGGIFLLKMVELGTFELIAPGCLIFYGLALINASKYTQVEIRYLGFCEIILGIISCWWIEEALYLWAAGFGWLHIIYGTFMWYKYERKQPVQYDEMEK